MPNKAYVTVLVTLTTAGTKYNLYLLAAAIEPNIPASCRELGLKTPLTNSGIVYIGDDQVSSTRYGTDLSPNAGDLIRAGDTAKIPFSNMFATGDTDGDKLAISVYNV